ncbi:MAG: hypothetical protein R3D55_19840 [Chloroflexota bacterium]
MNGPKVTGVDPAADLVLMTSNVAQDYKSLADFCSLQGNLLPKPAQK